MFGFLHGSSNFEDPFLERLDLSWVRDVVVGGAAWAVIVADAIDVVSAAEAFQWTGGDVVEECRPHVLIGGHDEPVGVAHDSGIGAGFGFGDVVVVRIGRRI